MSVVLVPLPSDSRYHQLSYVLAASLLYSGLFQVVSSHASLPLWLLPLTPEHLLIVQQGYPDDQCGQQILLGHQCAIRRGDRMG